MLKGYNYSLHALGKYSGNVRRKEYGPNTSCCSLRNVNCRSVKVELLGKACTFLMIQMIHLIKNPHHLCHFIKFMYHQQELEIRIHGYLHTVTAKSFGTLSPSVKRH